MKRKEIEFVIRPDGSFETTIKGAKGGSCKNIAEAFKTLGKVLSESRTSEFYEDDNHVVTSLFNRNTH
ncbi:MAG: DUF2997 domain-containing protein [Syntrophaceae bacterium]|nr:DUF2997 domain-containing protein [Syntrophaceae bacterium]